MLISLLIGAGSETTNLGGRIVSETILDHPNALERVRDDRSLIPQAVNEVMRFGFSGPAGIPRSALRDFDVRGRRIRKGQMLMLSFGGANRDPEGFDDPAPGSIPEHTSPRTQDRCGS
jgi:cytochrome P450